MKTDGAANCLQGLQIGFILGATGLPAETFAFDLHLPAEIIGLA